MNRILCSNCNSLLCKGKLIDGVIEIKCRKCGHYNKIEVTPQEIKTSKAKEQQK